MVEAVAFCHKQNIIHRGIKLENFLVDTDLNYDIIVKLSDFGLACYYDPDDPPNAKCGSMSTIAPEVMMDESYGPKRDCWSLGCLLFEMFADEVPFEAEKTE